MRKNIETVIHAFVHGRACTGDSRRTCRTDGETIFSYDLPIAWRSYEGPIVFLRVEDGPSRTTRGQIRAVRLALAS